MAPALLLGLAGHALGQEDGAPELPEGAAAVVDGHVLTMDEFATHLIAISGRAALDPLIDRILLRAEAARRSIAVTDEAIAAGVERRWEALAVRFRGDRAALEASLVDAGFQPDEYRAVLREEARDALLGDRLVRQDRPIDDAGLEAAFFQRYGVDGVKVRVRHIVLVPARVRAEEIARGTPASELGAGRVGQLLDARMQDVQSELDEGEDFASVAARRSHDISAKENGGEIPNYNYRAYGEAFAEAVRAAELGAVVGPIESTAGKHLIEVVERVRTDLADVRETLVAELAAAPATNQELFELRRRLREAAVVRTY